MLQFQKCPEIQSIVVVTKPEKLEEIRRLAEEYGIAKLSAVAPTALQMLGIPVPCEMTTPSLLAGKEPWSKTALNV